jgi:type II secretory pathway pseudopilin PulG
MRACFVKPFGVHPLGCHCAKRMLKRGHQTPWLRKTAFTLVEVILAILIISGIMTVLLYFYHRAAQVRQAALEETEFLSTSRMLFEQLTTELRSARVVQDQFIGLEGDSNSITFVCTSIPQMARWIVSTNETVLLPPATDLKKVSYWLLTGTNMVERRGIDRTEELLLGAAFTSGTNATEFVSAGETNLTLEGDTNLFTTNLLVRAKAPLTERVQYLQFRYWAGTNWVESWSGMNLPDGVEITMGRDPIPLDAAAEGYPFEFFRRVIYLPNSTHPSNVVQVAEPGEVAL